MPIDRSSGAALVAVVCTAQVFVQIGAYYWPALLPGMMQRWSLNNGEAGWITSAFYATYMVSVPVLVTLTDRIDAKRVYLFGVACFSALGGARSFVPAPGCRRGLLCDLTPYRGGLEPWRSLSRSVTDLFLRLPTTGFRVFS